MAGEMQAAADIMKVLFGQKSLGGMAQPFQAGPMGTQLNSDLTEPVPTDPFSQGFPSGAGMKSIEEMLGLTKPNPPQLPIGQAGTQDEIGGNADILARGGDLSGGFGNMMGQQQQMGPEPMRPPEELANEQTSPFSEFFGNLDQNLQSPSKVLGMGLLGQIDPRLGYGALAAMGLLGGK